MIASLEQRAEDDTIAGEAIGLGALNHLPLVQTGGPVSGEAESRGVAMADRSRNGLTIP